MKNKDKYDLRHIGLSIDYLVNGCGKRIDETRTITITYLNNKVFEKKSKENSLNFILNWLESEENPLK